MTVSTNIALDSSKPKQITVERVLEIAHEVKVACLLSNQDGAMKADQFATTVFKATLLAEMGQITNHTFLEPILK